MMKTRVLAFVLIGLLAALAGLNPFSPSFAVTPGIADSSQPIHVIGRMSVTLDQAERAEFDHLTHILFEQTIQNDRAITLHLQRRYQLYWYVRLGRGLEVKIII
jgi:uncharacterized protein YcfL